MILKHRYVIVPQCKLMLGIHKIHIVVPRVLKIVNRARQYHGEEIHIVQLSLAHPVATHDEVVHCLCDVSSVGLVVVGHEVVACLDLIDESQPCVQVDFELCVYRVLLEDEGREGDQFVVSGLSFVVEYWEVFVSYLLKHHLGV